MCQYDNFELMSKKRKTRKQKEHASKRILSQITHEPSETPSYTVKVAPKKGFVANVKINPPEDLSDAAYLKKDINSISAASGIILASEILLFVLLASGVLKLNFLGY